MHFVPYFIIQNHLGHNNSHSVSLHNLGLESHSGNDFVLIHELCVTNAVCE